MLALNSTIGQDWNVRPNKHVQTIKTQKILNAAIWGAELAIGEGRGRIYLVEPTGQIEDDPDLTDKKFPGNPSKSCLHHRAQWWGDDQGRYVHGKVPSAYLIDTRNPVIFLDALPEFFHPVWNLI